MCHYAVVRVTDDGGTGGSRLFKTKRGGDGLDTLSLKIFLKYLF